MLFINSMVRKITALKIQQHNTRRVNIFLDGEYAFSLERSAAAWLRIGQELGEEKIAQLHAEDVNEKAYQQALKLLNYRSRSASEVQKNLERHGVSEGTIGEVLERLNRSGLIDDNRFASDWVENRCEFRPRSRRALAIELRQRGLDDESISLAISDLNDEHLAYKAALKHSRRLDGLDWRAYQKKLIGFLARRGFYYDVIAPVVKRVWDEMHEDNINEEKS